jgi:hypothetical protein
MSKFIVRHLKIPTSIKRLIITSKRSYKQSDLGNEPPLKRGPGYE